MFLRGLYFGLYNKKGSIIKVGVPADRQRKKERAYPKKSDIM